MLEEAIRATRERIAELREEIAMERAHHDHLRLLQEEAASNDGSAAKETPGAGSEPST